MPLPIGAIMKAAEMQKARRGKNMQKGMAIGQLIAGRMQEKKSDALLPSTENAMERQMLTGIQRRRRALETGTAGSADRAAIRQMGKSFGRNMFQGGGRGNLGQIAAFTSEAMKNLAGTYGTQIGQTLQLEQQQVKSMADLANDISRLRSTRMAAKSARNIQGGYQNLYAAVGGRGGAGEKTDPNIIKSMASTTRATNANNSKNSKTPVADQNLTEQDLIGDGL